MTECTMCGSPLAPDAKTCSECGELVIPPSEPPVLPPTASAPSGPRLSTWVALALVVVCVAAGGIYWMQASTTAAPPQESFRDARLRLEQRWNAARDEYFGLLAETELIDHEDMERREIHLKPGVWATLSPERKTKMVELIALRVAIRRGDRDIEPVTLLEDGKPVASYDRSTGVSLR